MSKDLTRRAVKMLLGGATLLGQPCPYCKGVRVIKDGHALCTSCGREPEKRDVPDDQGAVPALAGIINEKIKALAAELEQADGHERQQEILKSINMHLDTLKKIESTLTGSE